jgi:hypothetical protein
MPKVQVHSEQDETLFAVLARQARGRSSAELWMTAVGGAVNATLLALLVPGLSWLATAFLCVAAYGAWGLADRSASDIMPGAAHEQDRLRHRRVLRGVFASVGVASAVWTMLAFMASALSGWNH